MTTSEQATLQRYKAQVTLLRGLLKETDSLLCRHHDSQICSFMGDCPVCTENHTKRYPDDIFGRIKTALDITNE